MWCSDSAADTACRRRKRESDAACRLAEAPLPGMFRGFAAPPPPEKNRCLRDCKPAIMWATGGRVGSGRGHWCTRGSFPCMCDSTRTNHRQCCSAARCDSGVNNALCSWKAQSMKHLAVPPPTPPNLQLSAEAVIADVRASMLRKSEGATSKDANCTNMK